MASYNQESPDNLGPEHFSDDHKKVVYQQMAGLMCEDDCESGQEGLTPEDIRWHVLKKIEHLCKDEEIYREFQLFLDERTVERQAFMDQRQLLQQQAQVIDVDDVDRINFQSEAEMQFPEDYPTEDLYSVYSRLYSHAMYQKRVQAEERLAASRYHNSSNRVSKTKGEQIGNRLYQEHV